MGAPSLTVLYDEDCGFCTALARLLGRRVVVAPIGSATGDLLLRDLDRASRYAAVHVVDADGRRSSGGAALPPLLRALRLAPVAAVAETFPALTGAGYELVARNRRRLSRTLGFRVCNRG